MLTLGMPSSPFHHPSQFAFPSHAVKYEAATMLTLPTQNPAAHVSGSASASTLISLIIKESDNNVKLIILDRLEALQYKHEHILNGLIMDTLQILGSSERPSTQMCSL
ncbi:hypothetical protein BT96DRAFT_988887 [Gymnopus androsaceus JB14]|uniref:Uncharacterized protein n=1 Tax=Gymnopus androsaceus JB14 TaxID=1447944 RepID=A0A6A4I7K3_9AGAR|nr:hypothetical protein BT96DRAFT_988887 [Gymnopus androsaceus JB14]